MLMQIEEFILRSTLSYYRKYHGPYRQEFGLEELEAVKRNITYLFDAFLALFQSLLDVIIKFAVSLHFIDQKLS